MLFIANFLIKVDFTLICVPCRLKHVCYGSFSQKKYTDLEDILCHKLVKICVLSEIHTS